MIFWSFISYFVMNEVPVDIETNAESYITLSKSFKSFQQKYLIVFTIVMGKKLVISIIPY